jgi:hypothetical protein
MNLFWIHLTRYKEQLIFHQKLNQKYLSKNSTQSQKIFAIVETIFQRNKVQEAIQVIDQVQEDM